MIHEILLIKLKTPLQTCRIPWILFLEVVNFGPDLVSPIFINCERRQADTNMAIQLLLASQGLCVLYM